jgi:small GTP-binding protein
VSKRIKLKKISKFLDPDVVDIDTIDQVGKLPISSFKFLSLHDEALIKDLLKVSKIADCIKLDRQNPFKKKIRRSKKKKALLSKIKKEDPEFEEKVKQAITISLIIQRIMRESAKKKRQDQKIIVVGLNNAGKTAILTQFGGKLGIKDLALLKPTRGVNRQEIKTKDLNLHLWDFGGQEDHRKEYLEAPEEYFYGIDLIIYVIDIQDPERYEESMEYFKSIIENVIKLKESPHVLIFIHKLDPDIREDNEVLLNIELVKDLIRTFFQDIQLNYDIYLTSIFSMISSEPQFSKFIKDVMADSVNLEDPTAIKVDELSKIIEKALNAVVQLSSSMVTLEERIESLEKPRRGRPRKKAPQEILPTPEVSKSVVLPPPPPPPTKGKPAPTPPKGGPGLRNALMSELKDIFVKKGVYREYDM